MAGGDYSCDISQSYLLQLPLKGETAQNLYKLISGFT